MKRNKNSYKNIEITEKKNGDKRIRKLEKKRRLKKKQQLRKKQQKEKGMVRQQKVRQLKERMKHKKTRHRREKLQKELFSFSKNVQYGFPHKPVSMDWDPHLKLLAIATKTGFIRIFGQPGSSDYII